MNHAIPTVYRGIEYRSRLEARWAAFFDEIGWQFTYEPFDGDGYIPAFLIHGVAPLLVEIKPAVTAAEYRAPITKVTNGLDGLWNSDILILGADPLPQLSDERWNAFAGVAGNRCALTANGTVAEPIRCDTAVGYGWIFANASWTRCTECPMIGALHIKHWTGRLCEHAIEHFYCIDPCEIQEAWAEACNAVKWYGRDAS